MRELGLVMNIAELGADQSMNKVLGHDEIAKILTEALHG